MHYIEWISFLFFSFLFCYRNRYAEALANYEKGMDKASLNSIQLHDTVLDEHKRMCEFGIARTNIKLGNLKKGVNSHNCQIYVRFERKK